MTTMNEVMTIHGPLKPCPFCGFVATLDLWPRTHSMWYIKCNHCGAQGPDDLSRENAINAWNTRPEKTHK